MLLNVDKIFKMFLCYFMFLCFIIVQNLILTEIFFILTLTDCLIDSSVNCKTVISVSKPFIDKVDLDDSEKDLKTTTTNHHFAVSQLPPTSL